MEQNIYLITAITPERDGTEETVWNQMADSEEEALRLSDTHFEQLGWPQGWKSIKATLVGTAPKVL